MKTPTTTPIALALAALLGAACDRTPVIDTRQEAAPSYQEHIINANKVIASAEETQIDSYTARRGWQMTRLGNGVRYMILAPGHGNPLDYEDQAVVTYRLELLTGTLVYDGQRDTVTLGRHEPNEGLDHALRQLRRGCHARVIVPSAMAYGVMGDGDRVPSRAVLVYDLQVQ